VGRGVSPHPPRGTPWTSKNGRLTTKSTNSARRIEVKHTTTMNTLVKLVTLTAGSHNLRPCFIGPTGCGKTARVRQLAAALDRPVITLLLQTMLPEDLLGLPRVVRRETFWALPDWVRAAAERPHVLFLDELDKPRPEVVAATLTLIWDLEVRGVRLHPETIVIGAMQPVDRDLWLSDETLRALAARLIFIPVSAADGYERLANLTRLPWVAELAKDEVAPAPPVLEKPSVRQLDCALRLIRSGADPELVIRGICGPRVADWILAKLSENPLQSDELGLTADVAAARLPELAVHGPAQKWAEALATLFIEGDPDLVSRALHRQYEAVAAAGQLCGDEPEEVIIEKFKEACVRVARAYAARRSDK